MSANVGLKYLVLILLIFKLGIHSVTADADARRDLIKRETRKWNSCPEDCECSLDDNSNKVIDCFNSGMVDLPQDIPGNAVTLNMSRNAVITVKEGFLDNLREITIIDLSHNQIKEIERNALQDQAKLRYLDLSYNKLTKISLDDLRQTALRLEVLNISNTEIRQVPELYDSEGVYMTKLTHLSMGRNYFTSIPPMHIPLTLKFLDISCLGVQTFKNTALSGLVELEELIIQGCQAAKGRMKTVERKAFATSVRLKRLDISNNDLNTVPVGLPPSLEVLDLSNNKIITIKQSECATVKDMQSRLYVNENNEYDEYGDGRLTRPVGTALSVLSNLRELRLNNNPIVSLCMDVFVNMERLEILNMTGCKLSSFHPHTFVYARSLQILDLSFNQMRKFKIDEISLLEELYLQYNRLESVDRLGRRTLPSLTKADFSGNPWRCDCKITSLLEILAYSRDIEFVNLHAFSVHYACAVPLKTKGKPLMTLDPEKEIECDTGEGINIVAIAAPASVGAIIVLIVIVIVISTQRDAKKRAAKRAEMGLPEEEDRCCCCGYCNHKPRDDYSRKIPNTRRNFNYPSNTLVRKNALLNDAAILCHVKDQKWILNKMVPEVNRYREDEQQRAFDHQEGSTPEKPNMNVFTIGQSIKIERLSKCIDSNRKIVLVVTHSFVEEESCILVLNVIRERMIREPKESVILLILDAIAWSTMPQSLQFLMVEKTFVQYPQDARGRQEFYFWDNVCSHMYNKTLRTLLPPVPEESDNPAFEAEETSQPRMEHPYMRAPVATADIDDVFPPMRPAGWSTGGRRMKGMTMYAHESEIMSPEREAKLKRLGLQKDGNLLNDAQAGISEARILGMEQKRSYQVPHSTNLPMQHIESIRRQEKEDIASVHKDIDDLYSTRGSIAPPRPPTSGRIRSLLPANEGDADSIYSEDEEIAAQIIRAPERQRSLPVAKTSHHHSLGLQADTGASIDNLISGHSHVSADHLHGTDKTKVGLEVAIPKADDIRTIDHSHVAKEQENSDDSQDGEKKKKKKNKKEKKEKRKNKSKKKK